MTMRHFIVVDPASGHKAALRTNDADQAARWLASIRADARKAMKAEPVVIEFEPFHGGAHGDTIVRALHRLHVDFGADGSALPIHLYPERAADDESPPCADNAFLTRRQRLQMPEAASRRHAIIKPDEASA